MFPSSPLRPADPRLGASTSWVQAAGGPWAIALAIGVIPYLVARGWVNAAVMFLSIAAAWQLRRQAVWSLLKSESGLRWMCLALVVPIAMVAVVQIAHGQANARPYDAPLRLVLSAVLLIWLYLRRVTWLNLAGIAFALASLASAVLVYFPGMERFYWGPGRAANYFVDPLSLAQHSMTLAFLCLFSLDNKDGWPQRSLKLAGFAAGLAVAISSGSRTGWTMAPLLALLWVFTQPWMEGRARRSIGLTVVALAIVGLGWGSAAVHTRLNEVTHELRQYFSGEFVDSSIGTRISLFRAAWAAFLAKPLVGWGFATLPTAADLPGTAALWTPTMTGYFVNNGTHNEWLQALMKMGLVGLVSRVFMYLVPFALFIQAVRSRHPLRRQAGYLGLVVIIGYLTSGMTSEVSNLIYLSSFYGLMMASLGAIALPPPGAKR